MITTNNIACDVDNCTKILVKKDRDSVLDWQATLSILNGRELLNMVIFGGDSWWAEPEASGEATSGVKEGLEFIFS